MKLCKDCKHAFHGIDWYCWRKKRDEIDPVHGHTSKQHGVVKCHDERSRRWFGCGPEGKYWEAK